MVDTTDFDVEFHSDFDRADEGLRVEAVDRLRELKGDHSDMIGAAVTVEELTGSETPHRYRARVVVYTRPEHTAAEEKGETALTALQGALDAVERQIRDRRERLRERWKQP